MSIAYLVACYILGSRYHSGQWSKGYGVMCLANAYSCREYGVSLGRHAEQLENHSPLYGSSHRGHVAYWLKRMRHSRHSL